MIPKLSPNLFQPTVSLRLHNLLSATSKSNVRFGNNIVYDNIFSVDVQIEVDSISQTEFTLIMRARNTISAFRLSHLAIDIDFPAHVNLFSDFPIDYGTTISDINDLNADRTPRSFTNTINYTEIAADKPYKMMSSMDYKVVVFLSRHRVQFSAQNPPYDKPADY